MKGSEMAYKAVMQPKEGTILTVARVVAEDALKQVQKTPDDYDQLINVMLKSGESILKKTPDMLPALPSDDTDADTTGPAEEEPRKGSSIDWDAELSKLLDDDGAGDGQAEGDDAQEKR